MIASALFRVARFFEIQASPFSSSAASRSASAAVHKPMACSASATCAWVRGER